MTNKPTTFIGWIEQEYREKYNIETWDVHYSLRDPDNPDQFLELPFETRFDDGDYSMSMSNPKMFRAVELMGQEMIDIAVQKGVNLKDFADLKAAFGYDINPDEISAAELGSYVIGVFMADSTTKNHPGPLGVDSQYNTDGFHSTLKRTEKIPRENKFKDDGTWETQRGRFAQKLSRELGKQVYGDNSPTTSSTDTSTEESLKKIVEILPTPR